jgi:transposase
MELVELFTKNLSAKQKQYEAIRAVAFQEGTIRKVAERFGYSPQTLRNLVNKALKGELAIFPEVKPGPKGRQTSSEHIALIIALRRQKRINSYQITDELKAKGISVSVRTVERVLSEAGFPKLRRRTLEERGLSKKRNLDPPPFCHAGS